MIIENDKSLLAYNSFHIEARADHFVSITDAEQLRDLLKKGDAGSQFVLGGGSNILFTRDVQGWVFKMDIRGIELIKEDESHVYVRAGAGENWHAFVQYAIGRNWAGLENLSLIPGSVGAAPIQNIGAYGVELKDVFYELEAYDRKTGKVYTFALNDCAFGYRDSFFKSGEKNRYIILNVTFLLNKTAVLNTSYGAIREELKQMDVRTPSIRSVSQAVINIRHSKLPDPSEIGNAGSFFKNPVVSQQQFLSLSGSFQDLPAYPHEEGQVKLAAGWLIEQCGWKGYRKGDAGVHQRQALVLVNYGHASGKDILDLGEAVTASVKKKFGVSLEKEVNIW
jgi:UDP-N-acetylmuramate dehydrogenase